MRCRPVLNLLSFGLLVAVALPARAAEAPAPDGELTNALVISTPFTHVMDLLRMPGLPRVFGGSLKEKVNDQTLENVKAYLGKSGNYWPSEVWLGMPASGFAKIDSLGRVFLLAALCDGATSAGAKGKKELAPLQKALIAELKRARFPTLVVTARFGGSFMPRLIAQELAKAATSALSETAVRLSTDGPATGGRVRVGQLLKPKALTAALVGIGWLSSARDPQAKAMTAAVGAVEVEAWVRSEGSEVSLSIGAPWRGKAPVLAAAPVKLAPEQLVAGARGEMAPLRPMVAGWRALWSSWEHTAAAAKAREKDDTDLLGDLEQLTRVLAQSGDRWDGWLWADRGLHGIGRSAGGPPVAPLASDPVAALLPADAIAVDVDASTNLGVRFSDTFSKVEERLARRSLKEILTSDTDAAGPAERAELAYYKSFAKLRELVHGKGESLFQGASALVVGGGARIPKLEVRDRAEAKPRAFTAVPVPELALVGRARDKDPRAAVAFVQDVWSAFAAGVREVAGARPQPASSSPVAVPAVPVSQGTAQWLDASWLDDLTKWGVWSDGGFKLHVATREDVVVLSTSPALTERILALRGASTPPKARLAPPAGQGPSLVGWSRYPCAPLAGQVRSLAGIVDKMLPPADSAKPSTPITTTIVDVLSGACNVVEGLSSTSRQEASVLETRVDLPAAAALYRPAARK